MAAKRKPPAKERYAAAIAAQDRALARGLREASETRHPRDMAEAKRMMRDPFADYEMSWRDVYSAFKSLADGEARHKARKTAPVNSNKPLLRALLLSKEGKDAFSGKLTAKKILAVVSWLSKRNNSMSYSAVEKMIRRARATKVRTV